jgi:hypothetical protein
MNALWILLALWIGTIVGFFGFALMAMARDSELNEANMFAPSMANPAGRSRRAATVSARS